MKIWVKRAPVAVCAVVMCGVAGWNIADNYGLEGRSSGSVAEAARSYADALGQQDAGAAAEVTTAPGQAADALTTTLQAMHAEKVSVEVSKPVEYSDGTGSFGLQTTWQWPKGRTFTTTSSGTARHLSSGWRVTWEPSIIYPGLPVGGQLREIRTDAAPAPSVRSRTDKPFMVLQPVNEIVLDPTRTKNLTSSTRALARTLAPIAPLVTPEVIADKLAETPGKPVTTVTLRNSDMQVLTSDPGAVPGVSVRKAGMLVMADRRLSSPLETGLTNYWQAIRDATAGWQVQMMGPGLKPRRLAGDQGPAGPNIPTTVDQNMQLTLGDAAVEVGQPATIMVLDARNGGILGMAQNQYAVDRGITVDQTYPVGATLDPVLAAIDRTATETQESSDALLDRLGLGVAFTVPGASAPTTARPGVQTIDFRSGDIDMSMMNMGALGVAMSRSLAGHPTSVAPYVISGVPTKVVGGSLGEIDSSLAQPILAAMRTTARTGDASDLTRAPGLRALVGTNGPQGPGWFVGLQDNKVVVVYCEGEKSGTAALQVAQKYFRIK